MFLENKVLDREVPIPLYFQLKGLIIEEISSGAYETDSLIPTENEISRQLGISRCTVRQAIGELVQEGYLYRIKSKGTFIARQKVKLDFLQRLETFEEQIKRSGRKPEMKVSKFQIINSSGEVADRLAIKEGEAVIYLFRRGFADGNPVATEKAFMPYEKCSFLMQSDFEKTSLYGGLSERENTKITNATHSLQAVIANSYDEKYLNVNKGVPMQLVHTVGYTRQDEPLVYSIARYRGDVSNFQVHVYMEPEQ
ncbi:MAG: GntR family transcriptional regulator [Lachnospiraceae bacterium]|nr:GntR family transcriptional regulator [Lachnospiraceae bacterium]MDD3796758.1 GntR family transcriptional regulator [Lachnospiraceae bacterium]